MFGVKLTVLAWVLCAVSLLIAKIAIGAASTKTKIRIELKLYPKWYLAINIIFTVLLMLGILGFVYSTIWVLFLR